MRKVVKLFTAQLMRVYFRLARPLLHAMREERACEYRQGRQELAAVCAAVRAEADQLARGRQELLDQVRAELARGRQELLDQVRAELGRMNCGFVEYHAVLTQKVADELTKMSRRLETPARGPRPTAAPPRSYYVPCSGENS
jgi:hypothetical protein